MPDAGEGRVGGHGRAAGGPFLGVAGKGGDGRRAVPDRGLPVSGPNRAERATGSRAGGGRRSASGPRAVARVSGVRGRKGPRPRTGVGAGRLGGKVAVPGRGKAASGLEGAAAWRRPRTIGHVDRFLTVFSFCTVRPCGGDIESRLPALVLVAAGAAAAARSSEVLVVSSQVGSSDPGQECGHCLDAVLGTEPRAAGSKCELFLLQFVGPKLLCRSRHQPAGLP